MSMNEGDSTVVWTQFSTCFWHRKTQKESESSSVEVHTYIYTHTQIACQSSASADVSCYLCLGWIPSVSKGEEKVLKQPDHWADNQAHHTPLQTPKSSPFHFMLTYKHTFMQHPTHTSHRTHTPPVTTWYKPITHDTCLHLHFSTSRSKSGNEISLWNSS